MEDNHSRVNLLTISNFTTQDHFRDGDKGSSSISTPGYHPSPTASQSQGVVDVSCHDWQDAQHTLFQLANLCAAVSLLTPGSFRHHLLFLRCLLLVAYLLFVLWAGLFVCMMDVLVWNCIFFFVDFAHIVCLTYNNIPSRFSPCLNELYARKLKPLKVCRKDFANLCNLGNVVPLRKGTRYSIENQSACGEKVSINLRGRLKVTHDGMFLHTIEANEFLDSPEFDSVAFQAPGANDKYQVTITAAEECLIISWMYPTIKAFLAANPFLSTVFSNIIGKDISDKLYKIQELLQSAQGEVQSSFTFHSSSLVDVCKCQSPQSGQRPGFANAQDSLSESALSLCSHHMNPATVETGV